MHRAFPARYILFKGTGRWWCNPPGAVYPYLEPLLEASKIKCANRPDRRISFCVVYAEADQTIPHTMLAGRLPGIVNLRNLLTVSRPRTTANLLICGPGVGRTRLKIVEIYLSLTM